MEATHCGLPMLLREREIDPTDEEASRGVIELRVFQNWCQKCVKKVYYTQEVFEISYGPMYRVRRNEIGSITKRLTLPKDSHWVWGYDAGGKNRTATFQKVKRYVR